jgi:DNA polymerase III delta prime subunit
LKNGIFGHETVLRTLERVVAGDRIPHAMLFTGPEGVGKRTVALRLAREIVAAGDREEIARFDRSAHDRFVSFVDVDAALPVRRGDLLLRGISEAALLEAYAFLREEGWIEGGSNGRGEDVVDLLRRNPDRLIGRRGIPFAEVLEKELSALERGKKPAAAVEVARALFSAGTSQVFYRRNLGIELVNGKGDGEYFRSIASLLSRASGGGWRVAVIDDAHKMTDEAQNAFLKTLEEPPPNTLLILVTSEPSTLLETIRSRCAQIVFDALPPREIERFLVETQRVGAGEAEMLAVLSGGSPGRALALRGVDVAERRDFATRLLASIAGGNLLEGLALVGCRLADSAREGAEGRDGRREEARLLLDLLALGSRDLALASAGVAPISGLDAHALADLSGRWAAAHWRRVLERAGLATEDLASNVEPRFAVEAMLAEVCVPAEIA